MVVLSIPIFILFVEARARVSHDDVFRSKEEGDTTETRRNVVLRLVREEYSYGRGREARFSLGTGSLGGGQDPITVSYRESHRLRTNFDKKPLHLKMCGIKITSVQWWTLLD